MELNTIQQKGKWSEISDTLNENFAKVNAETQRIELASRKNKGYFATASELTTKVPTALDGDIAYVGAKYPYNIYRWVDGAWVDSGEKGGEEVNNITNVTNIAGSIVNNPDDEDLVENNGVLKLKDRDTSKGMGYVILRTDKTFAEQVAQPNTIYEIRYDFDLGGEEVEIPKGCELKFEGGRIYNGIVNGKISNRYITPYMFGCIGDGLTDDTINMRRAIYNANILSKPLFIDNSASWLISDTLNVWEGKSFDLNIYIYGYNKYTSFMDTTKGIIVGADTKNISIFRDAEISGVINSIMINHQSESHTTDETSIFSNCKLRGLSISNCCFFGFNAFMLDSDLTRVSKVCSNKVRCFYFAKKGSKTSLSITDSIIEANYITGVTDKASNYLNVDNICFEFTSYNGSYIRNNFIDYFRTIYDTGENGGYGNINSISNHYQVFRYFYKNIWKVVINQQLALTSIGDAFNWTNEESSEQIIGRFAKDTYVGDDGNTYDVPPYILRINKGAFVTITDCILEFNLGNVIFFESSLSPNNRVVFRANISGEALYVMGNIKCKRKEGSDQNRAFLLPYDERCSIELDERILPELSTLPTFKYTNAGYVSEYMLGERIKMGKGIYQLRFLNRDGLDVFQWIKQNNLSEELTSIKYERVNNDGSTNVKYTTHYISASDTNDTLSSINVADTLIYKPITFYNYDSKVLNISALSYNNMKVQLQPYETCTFIAITKTRLICTSWSGYMRASIGATGDRTTSPTVGMQYFDSTLKKPIWWNGTSWVDCDGYPADIKRSGTSEERLEITTGIKTGQSFFDTTLGKIVYWNGTAWVDATGATV